MQPCHRLDVGHLERVACYCYRGPCRTRLGVAYLFDTEVARTYGEISAALEKAGTPVAEADLHIAAPAIHHDLDLVTGDVRLFSRLPGLRLETVLARAKGARS